MSKKRENNKKYWNNELDQLNDQYNLSTIESSVLLIINDLYNIKQGCAWPSINTIAKKARCCRTSVKNALRVLQTHGLIVVIERINTRKSKNPIERLGQQTNLYKLVFDIEQRLKEAGQYLLRRAENIRKWTYSIKKAELPPTTFQKILRYFLQGGFIS